MDEERRDYGPLIQYVDERLQKFEGKFNELETKIDSLIELKAKGEGVLWALVGLAAAIPLAVAYLNTVFKKLGDYLK